MLQKQNSHSNNIFDKQSEINFFSVQENKPAQTKAAPPQTKETKAEKDQNAPKPTTFKEKIGNVASGLKHAVTKNKDADAEKYILIIIR